MKKAWYKEEKISCGFGTKSWYVIYIRNTDHCGMGRNPDVEYLFGTDDQAEALRVCNRLNQ